MCLHNRIPCPVLMDLVSESWPDWNRTAVTEPLEMGAKPGDDMLESFTMRICGEWWKSRSPVVTEAGKATGHPNAGAKVT